MKKTNIFQNDEKEKRAAELGMAKPYFKIFLILVTILTFFLYLNQLQEKRVNTQSQINLARINQQNADSLKAALQVRLHLPTALASIVEIDPKFALQNFDAIAKTLIGDITGIISLQLAPNGIVTHVTDMARNQAVIGHNLLTDKRSKTLSLLAIKERRFTIAGPLTLRQGGTAIIARLPIYTKLQHTKSTASFWGFATILIDIDVLLAESHILSDDEHHSVALRGKDSGGQKDAVFFGNQEVFDNPADIHVMDLPYFYWEIAIKEKGRYIERVNPNWILWLWFIGGLLSITSSYLVMSMFNRKKELSKIKAIANDLTQLIDTANAPIFGIDAAGLVNEWNQRAELLTGFDKADVMGQDLVARFITDDYKVWVKEVLDKALKGEETANFEFPLFTKSGDRVDVLLNSTSRRDAGGNIVGVVGVGQDITELNSIRKEQESVANDLTQLIDTANAPIFGIDAAGLVNEWNQRAEFLTGFGKADVMGKDLVAGFITDDYKASVKEVLDKALKGEETANFEFPLFTNSGGRIDVLLNSTSRRDAGGNIVGVVGVGQDITELNSIRKEQESVANDLTQLIDTANAPIFGIDAAGLVNEWNQRAEFLTGFGKADVMGKDLVAGFITDDYKASVKEVLDKALKGEETANFEFPLFTNSGDRVDVLLNSTSRRDAGGNIVGVVGVGKDITELNSIRKEQERIRQKADTAKSEFISTVSHELRTPLTSIKGALGLMQSGVLDKKPEKLPAIVDIAYKNANRLNHLIDDILDIERLNVGKMNFHMESVDVSSLLEEAALSIESYGSQYGVTFLFAGTDERLLVNGDHHRLIQVMANLLSNAAKFSHRDGQVDLSVRRHDGSIRVSVQDYGIGIPKSARTSIFDNFTQVDSSDQRNTGGSGLGLGITKKIVEAHDGQINFTSEVDKGATFYFDLPALVVS
jgi:PAS domain S-box-containing protein